MINRAFNPHLSVRPGFPKTELPALFVWFDRVRDSIADDAAPRDMFDWVEWQWDRMCAEAVFTLGIYKDGALCGYCESVDGDDLAWIQLVLKRDLWRTAKPAVNLCLQDVFTATGRELLGFKVFRHNSHLKGLLNDVGARCAGDIAPRSQSGNLVQTDLYVLPEIEWQKRNVDFLCAVGERELAVVGV